MTAQVEVTIRYATTVDSLGDAWAFVMARVDGVGPDPSVQIGPVWWHGGGEDPRRRFEVVVSGMVEEAS